MVNQCIEIIEIKKLIFPSDDVSNEYNMFDSQLPMDCAIAGLADTK